MTATPNQAPSGQFTKKQAKKPHTGKRQYEQFGQPQHGGYGGPNKKTKMLLPEGMEALGDCIFDCEGKGTDFKRNLDKLSLYAGSHYDYGGDMANTLRNLRDIVLTPPTRPDGTVDRFEIMDYKVDYTEYIKQRNKIKS